MRILFDIDGVLAKWDKSGNLGNPPLWQIPKESNFFINLAPDERAVDTLRAIYNMHKEKVHIISQVYDLYQKDEVISQKKAWLNKHISFMPTKQIHLVVSTPDDPDAKANYVQKHFTKQKTPSILIDDRTDNLEAWCKSDRKFIGLKYENEFNTKYDYPERYKINKFMSQREILNRINEILKYGR